MILAQNSHILAKLAIWDPPWTKPILTFMQNLFYFRFLDQKKNNQMNGYPIEFGKKACSVPPSVVSWNILDFAFWSFWGQNYIACGDIVWFWAALAIFSIPLITFWSPAEYYSIKSRLCVCASVRWRSRNLFTGLFWFLKMRRKWRFGHFDRFWSKWRFLAKNQQIG